MTSNPVTTLAPIDYAVMAVYFVAVLGVGWSLRRSMRTSLGQALSRTLAAVNASGLQHNELWSYEIRSGKLVPVRYGTSSDVQLWNTTNLVVQYVLSKVPGLN